MPLTRTPHWATRELHDFLLQRANQPFRWGRNDCSLFAADAIRSFTGVDLAADFRGYTTKAEAMAMIQKVTGADTIEAAAEYCAKQHGLVEYQHPLQARRGDLVLVNDAGRRISAIVHLSGRHAVTVGARGLMRLSILNIARAWAI